MRHQRQIIEINGYTCIIHHEDNAKFFLIQPVDSHDTEELEHQINYIEEHSTATFTHIAVRIEKWNAELTPWSAPPVFGKIPFGEGANHTLLYIIQQLIPELQHRYNLSICKENTFLGGYSLAGLFALWASYQAEIPFNGIAAVSPSAWYIGWLDYAESHTPRVKNAYLSLGDKEEKTKTKLMSTISKDILRQEHIYKTKGVNCKMEWNEGNHFQDNGIRMAKGFVWLMQNQGC